MRARRCLSGTACCARRKTLATRSPSSNFSAFRSDGAILQHVPASRDGKQRRQGAALHIRVAAERLAPNGLHHAKHQRRCL